MICRQVVFWAFLLILGLCLPLSSAGGSSTARSSTNDVLDKHIKHLRSFLKSSPDDEDNARANADAWRKLGLMLQTKDVRQHVGGGLLQPEALEAFNNALRINNDDDKALSYQVNQHRGMLLKMMSRGEEAVASHDAAYKFARTRSEKSEVLSNKAAALVMMGRLEEAIHLYKQALQLTPKKLSLYLPLVQAYQEKGSLRGDQWKELFDRIQKSLPKSSKNLDALSGNVSRGDEMTVDDRHTENNNNDDDDEEEELEKKSDGIGDLSAASDGSSVYWALFMVAEKLKSYDEAWKYLEVAHKVEIANREPYDEDGAVQQSIQLKSIFTRSFWPNGVGSKSKKPIFIVGMMRSGSTLLETMLDAHPNIWGMGEDSIFNGKLPQFRNDLVRALSTGLPAIQKVVSKHGKAVVGEMLTLANASTDRKASPIKHVVDKMLFNYRNIGFIHLVFPNALILHTMRDPMDTVWSCYKHKFDDIGLEWSLDGKQLARQYARYVEIVQHFRNVLPGRVMDIRYEKLIEDPESIMRSILSALDLPWNPAVLKFYSTNRTVHTHSQSQVRHKISSKYVGVWRNYAPHLASIAEEMKAHLSKIDWAGGGLPYRREINWDLDPEFSYNLTDAEERSPQDSSDSSETTAVDSPESTSATTQTKQKKTKNSKASYVSPKTSATTAKITANKRVETVATKTMSPNHFEAIEKFGKKAKGPKKPAAAKEPSGDISKLKGPEKEVMKTILDKINSKASLLSGMSTVDLTSIEIRKSLREKDLASVYELYSFDSIVATAREANLRPLSAPQQVQTIDKLDHRNKDSRIDELVAVGYSLVNQAKYVLADEVFRMVLSILIFPERKQDSFPNSLIIRLPNNEILLAEDRGSAVDVLLGQGTAMALSGRGQEALEYFTRLLKLDPDSIPGRSRRYNILSSLGQNEEALEDVDTVIHLLNDTSKEHRFNRGNILFLLQRYSEAYKDFSKAVKLPGIPTDDVSDKWKARVWHHIGKCDKEFGDTNKALKSYAKSRKYDPSAKQVYLDTAFTLMEASRWNESLVFIDYALKLDPNFKNAYGYRGLLLQNLGDHSKAIADFKTALSVDPTDEQCMYLCAMCMQALAQFDEAQEMFDRLLKLNPSHMALFRADAMHFVAQNADKEIASYNVDKEMNINTRQALSKGSVSAVPESLWPKRKSASAPSLAKLAAISHAINRAPSSQFQARVSRLLNATSSFGSWIQLDSPGFLPNRRHHAVFGLSSMNAAQKLYSQVEARLHERRPGRLTVADAASSEPNYFGVQKCSNGRTVNETGLNNSTAGSSYHVVDCGEDAGENSHTFGWRDFFDELVKWRQLSEPMDIVFWIDGLPPAADFRDRVGLNTYMFKGSNKVIRYYPYFGMAFNKTQSIISSIGLFDRNENLVRLLPRKVAELEKARSLKELFKSVGSQPFFVVVPCQSKRDPSLFLNGTRITLIKSQVEGWEFSICSASTPERFQQYEVEMHQAFQRVLDKLEAYYRQFGSEAVYPSLQLQARDAERLDSISQAVEDVLTSGLELFYYWVNFAPITRGTSATGYTALYACMLAASWELTDRIPKKKQLDWEAILTSSPEEFISRVRPWFQQRRPRVVPSSPDGEDSVGVEVVSEVLPTAADRLAVLAHLDRYQW